MRGAAFNFLKVGRRRRKSAEQAQTSLAILPKILRNRFQLGEPQKNTRDGCIAQPFPEDMANSPKIVYFVNWIIFLARKLIQNARGQMSLRENPSI
jgi:hypothetical protein